MGKRPLTSRAFMGGGRARRSQTLNFHVVWKSDSNSRVEYYVQLGTRSQEKRDGHEKELAEKQETKTHRVSPLTGSTNHWVLVTDNKASSSAAGRTTKRASETKPGGGRWGEAWRRVAWSTHKHHHAFYDHHHSHLTVSPLVKSWATTQRETGCKPQGESHGGFREQELVIREHYYTLVFLGFRKRGLTDSTASSVQ